MSRTVVGPFNRVEGDLEVTLDIERGIVVSAQVTAPLYRGFENLLLGRPLFDALVMVPRICGICSVSQSAAAVAALADLSGATMPRNGRLASNLILASEVLLDHLTHFYLFFMPDFARADYAGQAWYDAVAARFRAQQGSAAADFLPARARFLTVLGLLAGKWPHTLALRPAGSTRPVHGGERMRLIALLREFRSFLERFFFAERLEVVASLDSTAALARYAARCGGAGDWPRFLALAESLQLARLGRSGAQLMSSGAFPDADEEGGAALFKPGVERDGGAPTAFDPGAITEDISHGWFVASANPLPPACGETRPQAEQAAGYSWAKAPRYAGAPAEVGAFARQVIDGQPLLLELAAQEGANARSRVVARGVEVARLLLAMQRWADGLDDRAPFHGEAPLVDSGRGVGFVEAARGTLGHWLEAEAGKIRRYQIVAPTTWNFSPRDAAGTPGPLETALAGLPTPSGKAGPEVQHVVRSFDPCLACTVH